MGLWLNGCRVPLETTYKVGGKTATNPAGTVEGNVHKPQHVNRKKDSA